MSTSIKDDIESRYKRLFGYRAGYLPKDLKSLTPWYTSLEKEIKAAQIAKPNKKLHKSVAGMAKLIEQDGIVRMFADEMIQQQYLLRDPQGKPIPSASIIKSIPDMLAKLNHIVTYAPWFSDPSHFPMSSLFAYAMMTVGGESLFRNPAFNTSLTAVLNEWCNYLTSKKSLSVINSDDGTGASGKKGWLCADAYGSGKNGMKLWEFYVPNINAPHWGFKSYNDYFHRNILDGRQKNNSQQPSIELYPEQHAIWLENATSGSDHQQITNFRPIAKPDDPRVIVSANDGTVSQIANNICRQDQFWLKGTPYSLSNMLDGNYVDRFVGGRVIQSFLSGANYHQLHAPIEGIVRCQKVVQGLTFSQSQYTAGWDTTGTDSLVYESAVNTRALIFIESPIRSIGMVCVMPIGITEISSITITVQDGQKVKKGDPLAYFNYGGSTLAMVFKKGAISRFTVHQPTPDKGIEGSTIKVNSQIAIAR